MLRVRDVSCVVSIENPSARCYLVYCLCLCDFAECVIHIRLEPVGVCSGPFSFIVLPTTFSLCLLVNARFAHCFGLFLPRLIRCAALSNLHSLYEDD